MKLKKIIAMLLALAMMLAMAACSSSGISNASGNSGNSAASGSKDDSKVYTLKLDCVDPSTSITAVGLERFKAEVEEKSEGRIQINIFYGSTLGALADAYDNLLMGTSDMAWGANAHYTGRFPCTEGLTIPFMGAETPYQAAQVLWDLYETDEQFQKEYQDVKVLALHTSAAFTLTSAGKDPTDLNTYAGLKVRTSSSNLTNWASHMGLTPIALGAGEVYEALSKGVVNMAVWDVGGLCNYKVYEQIDSMVEEPICFQPFFLLMNKDSYNELPEDLRAVIDECSGQHLVDAMANDWQGFADTSKQTLIDEGVKMVTLSGEVEQAWMDAAELVRADWIETLNGLGYDGQAMNDALVAAIEANAQ